MQPTPEKTVANLNEYYGKRPPISLLKGVIELETIPTLTPEQDEVVNTGVLLVDRKVKTILGSNNRLTSPNLAKPTIRFVDADLDYPHWAGYFDSDKNTITIVTGQIPSGSRGQTKVFIHEYLHFLSHNGRNNDEVVRADSPIAQQNNVGFRRHFGLDIRKGKENQLTSNYFLAFNEAVTEQLAIDIFPGVHETYEDYRDLLNQVINDAVTLELGTYGTSGILRPLSAEQVKDYIYLCFFKGDLTGFTELLQTVYAKYGLSEQQFGLMTDRKDLPTIVEKELSSSDPQGPPPAPANVAIAVQQRLDAKTPADYTTDILDDQDLFGNEYDTFISENGITIIDSIEIGGRKYDIDTNGHFIYHNEDAEAVLTYIKDTFDELTNRLQTGEIDVVMLTEAIDYLLFEKYKVSMLSDGFRDFYIYKHRKIHELTSAIVG